MTLNKQIDNIEQYAFRVIAQKAAARAEQLKKENDKRELIRLGVGTPDIHIPLKLRKAMADVLVNDPTYFHGYPDDSHPYKGIAILTKALADDYKKRHGVSISADNFVIDAGAKPTLHNLAKTLSNPGETIAIQEPFYPAYRGAAIWAGYKMLSINCTKENNYEPSLEFLEDVKNLAFVYWCSPNNPTSKVSSKAKLKELADRAEDRGFYVLLDVAYKDLAYDGRSTMSGLELDSPNMIEVGSFSKTVNFTNQRLGWAVSHNDELIKDAWSSKTKAQIDSGVSPFIQYGGYVALTDPEVRKEMMANVQRYKKRKDILIKALKGLGITFVKPHVAPYIWADLPKGFSGSWQFTDMILDKAAVVLTPGITFGESGDKNFRMTVFQPREKLKEAAERISGAV